jgi:hypothetical protein
LNYSRSGAPVQPAGLEGKHTSEFGFALVEEAGFEPA